MLIAVSALRFLYKVSLKRLAVWRRHPCSQKPLKLPVVLSPEEVMQFLDCVEGVKHRAIFFFFFFFFFVT